MLSLLLSIISILLLLPLTGTEEIKHIQPTLNGTHADNLPGNNIVCTPTNWYDIVWFYFANYIMHALSVRSLPGENLFTSIVFKLACLMIPYTGIRRGLCLISRASNIVRNDLQAAARANALCMIVRSDEWKPLNEEEVSGCRIETVGKALPDSSDCTQEFGVVEVRNETAESDKLDREKDFTLREADKSSTSSSDELKEEDTIHINDTKEKEQGPIMTIKPAATCSTTASEEGSGRLILKLTDSYVPVVPQTYLEKLYIIFVETHKFGRTSLRKSIKLDPEYVKVHGLCTLPPGYELIYVPQDVKVHSRGRPDPRPDPIHSLRQGDFHNVFKAITSSTRLASTQNAPRILFSLSQTISGGWSLYRAQGLQIDRFGWAAYGLTVLPYMIVSVINFMGSLLTKEYDMVYLVHSCIMDEMISRGGTVDGVVGSVDPTEEDLGESTAPSRTAAAARLVRNFTGEEIFDPRRELISPEGETVQFRTDPSFLPSHDDLPPPPAITPDCHLTNQNTPPTTSDDPPQTYTYRPSSPPSSTWSASLPLHALPSKHSSPLEPMSLERRYWHRLRRCFRRKHRNDPGPQPPAGSTIISIPCHGPLIRLPPPIYDPFLHALTLALLIASMAVPWIVITLLTGWKANQSQSSHRSFVMNWLVCGMLLGYGAGTLERLSGNTAVVKGLGLAFLSYGSYCISGFVAVAQEMVQIGKCTAL